MTPRFTVRPMRRADTASVAALHESLFGSVDGLSIARLGRRFLDAVFYQLNLDNPAFRCDVADDRGTIVGFSVWTTDRTGVFRHLLRRRPLAAIVGTCRAVVARPSLIVAALANLRYLAGERLPPGVDAQGWWLVAGVRPECREPAWEADAGGQVAAGAVRRHGNVDAAIALRCLDRRGARRQYSHHTIPGTPGCGARPPRTVTRHGHGLLPKDPRRWRVTRPAIRAEATAAYLPHVLAEVPRLLSQMDREPSSPGAGSFDRDWWAWKFRDGPITMLQAGLLPLATLWRNRFQTTRSSRTPRWRSGSSAGLRTPSGSSGRTARSIPSAPTRRITASRWRWRTSCAEA
jgi:hypothetical protein